RIRERERESGAAGLREAEVEKLCARPRQHDVAGLEVAVHDAGAMRGIQRTGNLDCDAKRGRMIECAVPEPRFERIAFEVFDDQIADRGPCTPRIERFPDVVET